MTHKTKGTNLKLVERSEEEKKRYQEEYDRWEKAEKEWRMTSEEVNRRVQALRMELEAYRDQIEGVPFDIACGDYETPSPLEHRRQWTVNLVENLNPVVNGFFHMIDDYAETHGTHDFLDFNAKLFDLKSQTAETGFKMGVLAGVIFAGCSKKQIDRFERGLAFALKSDRRLVKGSD